MSKNHYSQSQVQRITGKSRTTIKKHMDSGRLSYVLDDDGNKVIERSEIIRVYDEEHCDFDKADLAKVKSAAKTQVSKADDTNTEPQNTKIKIEYLERMLEQNEAQIENLQASLKLSQEGHNRTTLLLEDKSGGAGDIEKEIKALEVRMINQEASNKKRIEKEAKILKQNEFLKKALHTERNKSLFQRVFGKKSTKNISQS